MVQKLSFMQILADVFPFGKQAEPARAVQSVTSKEEGMSEIAKQFGGDLTSKEAFEAYKAREVDISTKSNFLRTVGGYLNMITTSLGGMAIGLLALLTPLKALIPGATQTLAGLGGASGIMAFFIPISIAAVAFGIVTLAVGQYATRMETARQTDNSDFYTRRGSQIGAKLAAPIQAKIQSPILAKAIVEELNNNAVQTSAVRTDGRTWAQAVRENADNAIAEETAISKRKQDQSWGDSTRENQIDAAKQRAQAMQ